MAQIHESVTPAETDPRALPISEAVQEAAEDAALTGQRRGRRRRDRTLPGHRLVVVGPRDGIDDLLLIEVVGPLDHGYETDEHSIAHHLSLNAGGAIGVPFPLTPAGQRHADPELA